MGVLADLILAESADMQAIIACEYPLGTYKGGNADGLDPLMLAELHALLGGQEYSAVLPEYRPTLQASEQGPWLIRIPPDLVRRLADLPPQDYGATASRWAAGEQMREQAIEDEQAEQLLERTAFLAQTAAFEGKELFLTIY
ncbi:MAG: hypothetical protein MUO23_10980 [Anaerolineales bacterium]|nr:hypothetical protein [Anaerolineales bacterium]